MQSDWVQQGLIAERILKATRPGDYTKWVERIGEFATQAGLDDVLLSKVNWLASPSDVAFDIVMIMACKWHIDKLTAELDRREQKQ